MSRRFKIAVAVMAFAVVAGFFYLWHLRSSARELAKIQQAEEQAQSKLTQTPITTPTDAKVKARIFWASATNPASLDPVEIELPLSADPIQRSRQLVAALIQSPPSAPQRTLPAEASLLAFYLLPDGTAIADFSDSLSTGTPSGILSEELAVNSITQTLAASVPQIRRLKILLHGQEADTLAGHLDLTVFFPVNAASPAPLPPPGAPPAAKPNQ
ncbi:MAG TPA: GerMN domain-containing protein [Candidatus Acidoferrum sp.]|nr:GerMN domain-containing protein [Candidatus Acidoferrum sp.]